MADKQKSESDAADQPLEADEAQVEEHVQSGEELYDPASGVAVGGPIEPFEALSEPHRDHVLDASSDDPGDTSSALPPPADESD